MSYDNLNIPRFVPPAGTTTGTLIKHLLHDSEAASAATGTRNCGTITPERYTNELRQDRTFITWVPLVVPLSAVALSVVAYSIVAIGYH